MSENKQDLPSKLVKARQQLQKAQIRISELESQFFKIQPTPAKLQVDEAHYRRMMDIMVEGCQIIGFDWRYLYVNDVAARQGRQSKDELLGYTMLEKYPNIEKTPLFAVIRRCMDERRIEFLENEVNYSDGTSGWFEQLVQPVPEGVFILSHDITTRKKLEEALRLSEEMFSSAFHIGPAGLTITRIADGKFINANQAFCEMFELSRDEVIGHTSTELNMWTPEERQRLILQQKEAGGLHNFELTAHSKSGRRVHVLFSSKELQLQEDICHLTTMIDITERKQAGETLRSSEIRFRSLVEAVEDYAIYLLDVSGNVVSWNVGAERLKGYRSDEIIGQHFSSFFTPEEQQNDKPKQLLKDAESNGRIEDEGWRVRKDGSRFWANVVITALRNTDGALYGFAKITRDLTQRKYSEANIRKLHRTLGVLSDINQAIVRIRHLPSLFEKACEIAVEKGAFRMAWIGLLEPKSGRINPVAQAGPSDDYIEKLDIRLSNDLQARNPLVNSFGTGVRWVCNDLENDPQVLPWRDDALRLGYRASVALPLTIAGEVHGMFNLYADEVDFFDADELRLMDEMAGDVSLAMEIVEQEEQRLKTEAALRISEEKYRSLIESAESVITVFDVEGTFLFANRVAATGLGLTPETLTGRNMAHVFPPSSAQRQLARIRQVIETGEGTVYEAISVVLGEDRWYRSSVQPIRDGSGQVTSALVNTVDITHLKQAEAILRSERDILERKVVERTADMQAALVRVEAILNNSPDAILLVNSDLTIQQANSSFNALFGSEPDMYSGKSLRTLLHLDDASRMSDLSDIPANQQNGRHIEVHAIRKDGTTFEAELNIGIIQGNGLVCIIRDISERKAQERQLHYNAALQESVSDAVIVIDMENKVQSWNKAAELIYGWIAEEAIGEESSKFLHYEASAEQHERDMQHVQEFGWLRGEIRQFHKDGHLIHIWSSITRIQDENAKPLSVIAVNHDISERKVQERQLRYHASIQQSVSDAVIATDMDFNIQSWNRAAETIYGWNAAEAIGKSANEILQTTYESEVDRVRIRHDFLERGAWQAEVIQRHRDGSPINILASVNLFKDEVGQPFGVVSVNRDITERKQAQKVIIESEARYRLLAENIADVIMTFSLDRIITYMSPSCERILGYLTEEVVGKSHSEFIHPEDYPQVIDRTRQAVAWKENFYTNQFRLRHKAGPYIWYEVRTRLVFDDNNGEVMQFISVLRDMTERRHADDALRESEARYRLLAENISDVITRVNASGDYTYASSSCQSVLGYDAEELLGNYVLNFVHPDDFAIIGEMLSRTLQYQKEAIRIVSRFRHKQGHYIWLETSGRVIYADNSNDVVGLVLSSRDITDRKQAEAALSQSEKRFRRAIIDAPFPIMIHADDGEVLAVSNVWTEISGYRREEIPTMSDWIDKAYAGNSQIKSAIEKVYSLTKAQRGGEFRIHTKSGEERVWDFISAPLDVMLDGRRMVSSMAMDITERKHAEDALKTKVEEERTFQNYLKALHEITIELTQIDELDVFYKRVVELGLRRLGFERVAMFLYDKTDGAALGTYGTDSQGEIVDERHIRFTPDPNAIMLRAFNRAERFYFDEHIPLFNDMEAIGFGWNAATVLWNGTESLGWLVADNLLRQTPASNAQLNILGLYGLTVGTLLAQKQIQIELKESETRYRLLADNITDVVVRANAMGEYIYLSPSSRTIWGYDPIELLGKSIGDFVHPDDLADTSQIFMGDINQDNPIINLVVRFRHKQGHYVWMETVGRALFSDKTSEMEGFITSSRDISDRKQAEEALRESEAKYRSLIETMRGGFVIFDIHNRVTYVNDRFCEFLGYSREEAIGTTLFDYIDQANRTELEKQIEQRQLSESSTYEIAAKHRDGHLIHMLVSSAPLLDKNGAYIGGFAVTTDITTQKEAETKLRNALEKEKELGELKSRFVSMASHEFRTPLATIHALTDTLMAYRHKLLDAEIEERLIKIQGQIGHLKDIMEDVLLLARIQARRVEFNPTKINLDSLSRSVVDEFQNRPDIAHQFIYTCDERLRDVILDKKLMRQIINNLTSNATKYSPPDSSITINLMWEDNTLIFEIKDQGIGIPEEDLKHLFEPFHRAGNVGTISGTGLGLVIIKESVELHNGTISVDSQVGTGTTFKVSIPLPKQGKS